MKKAILFISLIPVCMMSYGQIIADHTVVDKFDDIPQYYIDQVKKMWLVVAGESHSEAYRTGMTLLESMYPEYAVSVKGSGTPEAYTEANLRVSRATWGDYSNRTGWIYGYGEEDWFTNATAVAQTKAGLTYCNTHNLNIAAMGFGWCYDMVGYSVPSGSRDPVYGCYWFGDTKNGPEGNLRWGLDAGDRVQTGNSVCMDTYLNAVEEYISHCKTNGYSTKVFFTTGPAGINNNYEPTYQGYVKHEYIRNYVKADASRILFDYADIVSYDDDGSQNLLSWNGHVYPGMTLTNLGDGSIGHIGSAGAIRLAKAMWWMLARIAGWDGGEPTTRVTSVTVNGANGASVITTPKGTLQLSVNILPANASDKTVTWSLVNGTGSADINASGLVTAAGNGTVTARATANDGSGVFGTLAITISNQSVPVSSISVTGQDGTTTISTDNGNLQLYANILPSDATDKDVTWSVDNGTGKASVSSMGLVTAAENGTVTVRATANDGSGVFGTLVLTISNQVTDVNQTPGNQIIADHTIVDRFDDIPEFYIEQVKKMWLVAAGEVHSDAYRTGMALLEASYPKFAVSVKESGTPEAYTESNLRVSSATWGDYSHTTGWIYGYGEEDWFTTQEGIAQTKTGLTYSNTHNLNIAALGLCWGFDMIGYSVPTGERDPVYGCYWFGDSKYGPEGNIRWGLNADDYTLTGNSICLDTYLNATQDYIDYCNENGYDTKVFFTTGPLGTQTPYEPNYQGHIKNEYIRDFVAADPNRILFDFADILAYNDDGTQTLLTWNSHTYPVITATNLGDKSIGYIGSAGAIRLAKAMWWMLARIAGWDGGEPTARVTSVTVNGANGASAITTPKGTLQLSVNILPANASDKTVTWSLVNGTGSADINASGLVTAAENGTVTARATANDGSGVFGTMAITISNQSVPVSSISVTGEDGATTISTDGGSLQLYADILPSDATDKDVTWSVDNGTGKASVSSMGLVTAAENGTITVRATANDGTGISGTIELFISNQATASQIIADHTIVDRFDDIPEFYIEQVKKMWLVAAGEVHSDAYRTGMALLEASYPKFAVSVKESGTPEAYTESNLRVSSATWGDYSHTTGWIYGYGEEDWFTTQEGIAQTKTGLTYSNTHNLNIAALGLCWGFEMISYSVPTGERDPVYGCYWFGDSKYGPEGNMRWGLNADDNTLTGNSICLDTYLNATQDYIDYCTENGYDTKIFFTTGPLGTQIPYEPSYQGHVKNEYIRDFVAADPNRILFDFADILAYNDDGTQTLLTWNGHTYPVITATNLGDKSIGYIGSAGVIRLAKAMWWMLARIAGWDGSTSDVQVAELEVEGENGAMTIDSDGGTLQLKADIYPPDATNKDVKWSLVEGADLATINASGLITATRNGMIRVEAAAIDGSGIRNTSMIAISNQNEQADNADDYYVLCDISELKVFVSEDYLSWQMRLLDLHGNIIINDIVRSDINVYDVSNLPSGIYIISLSKGESLRTIKTIKP